MGEVYRAEDLTLDHPVALKFLPEGAASDPASPAQFHNELRIARQVSHANTDQNFRIPPDSPRWLVDTDQTTGRWNRDRVIAGPALLFWYGASPRDLDPDSPSAT